MDLEEYQQRRLEIAVQLMSGYFANPEEGIPDPVRTMFEWAGEILGHHKDLCKKEENYHR